jgi:prepilin-type N-terminal cleavage/methylation domain-containing protein
MIAEQRMRRARHRFPRGFTLIEMMIVVAVIGILSALAIPSFQSYVYRSRTSEAVTFLGEIRQRQESYRSEFGQYCGASGTGSITGPFNPPTMPAGGVKGVFVPNQNNWAQLGAVPDGVVNFQYRTNAGLPGSNPGVPGYDGTDFWFVSQARGDLDGDGEVVIFESYSAGNHIYIGDGSLAPLVAGWE